VIKRRDFLRNGSLLLASAALGSLPKRSILGSEGLPENLLSHDGKIVVEVFLRGGMDGLMAVSPRRDDGLRRLRPSLFMGRRTSASSDRLLQLNDELGLHPAFKPLFDLYQHGELAIVSGIGTDAIHRSHESAVKALDRARFQSRPVEPTPAQRYEGQTTGSGRSQSTVNRSESIGRQLQRAASTIKARRAMRYVTTEMRGWDTHVHQGTLEGEFASKAGELSAAIASFWDDVRSHHGEVIVFTTTEFGRSVRENSSRGTDHGWAFCSFVLGGSVRGGEVYRAKPRVVRTKDEFAEFTPSIDPHTLFSRLVAGHLSPALSDAGDSGLIPLKYLLRT